MPVAPATTTLANSATAAIRQCGFRYSRPIRATIAAVVSLGGAVCGRSSESGFLPCPDWPGVASGVIWLGIVVCLCRVRIFRARILQAGRTISRVTLRCHKRRKW